MTKRPKAAIGALLAVLLVGACSSATHNGGQNGVAQQSTATTAPPVAGGTLTFGTLSPSRGLDPILSSGTGSTGGIELAALYDTIVRYNPATRKYEMRTAQSLTPNGDYTQWTLKLRSGITFGDGTPYDAAAVKFNFGRLVSAKSVSGLRGAALNVTAMDVVDPLTLRFILNEPWTGFPYLLAGDGGFVASPTAIQKLGDSFNVNPVGAGAGPFQFESFQANEAVTLRRNPNYWGGPVYLDEVRFVPGGAADSLYASLTSGGVQAAFLRDPGLVDRAKTEGVPFTETPIYAGTVLAMNNGITGTSAATANPMVRQAVAAAIDPNVVNDRAYAGKATATSALVTKGFPWDPGVPGPTYNPVEAKRLLGEAKAAGYDGKIRLLGDNVPADVNWALAVEAMLKAVGFDVSTNTGVDVNGKVTALVVKHDFDLVAVWGWNITPDDGAAVALETSLGSNNRYGYKSAEMDGYIKTYKAAVDDAARTAAMKNIATLYAKDLPGLSVTTIPEATAWAKNVHGITPTASSIVLLDKTSIGK